MFLEGNITFQTEILRMYGIFRVKTNLTMVPSVLLADVLVL